MLSFLVVEGSTLVLGFHLFMASVLSLFSKASL